MKPRILFFKILLISIFSTFSVQSADIIVNSSGISGTYSTISAAISAASSGDIIIVSAKSIPYNETLNIDKSLTIRPFAENTYIAYEGDINITVDAVSELTLIGFQSNLLNSSIAISNIFSVFNDTTRNSLTTINIIDSKFNDVHLNQVKTSTYLSYSAFADVYITHGDVTACSMNKLIIGKISCNYTSSSNYTYDCLENFSPSANSIGNGNYPSECGLFSDNINFGNVSPFSDTINIVANNISYLIIITEDFPVNIRNNSIYNTGIFLLPNSSKGTSQIINNEVGNTAGTIFFNLVYCSANNTFNFRDITIRILNNKAGGTPTNEYVQLNEPTNMNYALSNLTPTKNSIFSYNSNDYIGLHYSTNSSLASLPSLMFEIGPRHNSNFGQNPSSEFLDLDLSLNSLGLYGGSYSQKNYLDSIPCYWLNCNGNFLPAPGWMSMGNRKARITYLNLPTQIFDPASIKVKAKAVHGK